MVLEVDDFEFYTIFVPVWPINVIPVLPFDLVLTFKSKMAADFKAFGWSFQVCSLLFIIGSKESSSRRPLLSWGDRQ